MTTNAAVVARNISLELLDPPLLAMRETIDEGYIDELATSIRDNGLIQPIVVRAVGDRYEIIAGHCRSLACRRAPLFSPPCVVVVADDKTVEALKIAENTDRLNVNPADEAEYLDTLLSKLCEGDIEQLSSLSKRSISYLNSRLDLFRGHKPVFDALKAGSISLTVAGELNRFTDVKAAQMHLEQAIQIGATGKAVREWRRAYENFELHNGPAIAAGEAAMTPTIQTAAVMPVCICCRRDVDTGSLRYVPVHDYCQKAILTPLLAGPGGLPNA